MEMTKHTVKVPDPEWAAWRELAFALKQWSVSEVIRAKMNAACAEHGITPAAPDDDAPDAGK
jgi:hypothetical protein